MEPGADAIIIEGAREARVVSPLDRDARRLKASLSQRRRARGRRRSRPRPSALAADRLRSLGGKRRVLIVTDGALASDAPLAASGMDLQVVTVGEPVDNVGIVRIDVRAGVDPTTKHDQVQVFGMLEELRQDPARRVRDADGRREARSGGVAPHPRSAEREDRRSCFRSSRRRSSTAKVSTMQVSPGDALPIDDVAFGRVPHARKMPVVHASTRLLVDRARARRRSGSRPAEAHAVAARHRERRSRRARHRRRRVPGESAGPRRARRESAAGNVSRRRCRGAVEQPQITSWEQGDARLRFLDVRRRARRESDSARRRRAKRVARARWENRARGGRVVARSHGDDRRLRRRRQRLAAQGVVRPLHSQRRRDGARCIAAKARRGPRARATRCASRCRTTSRR